MSVHDDRPPRARCVLLAHRGSGADVQEVGTVPVALMRVLRRRDVELHVRVDSHDALATVLEFVRIDDRIPTVLLIVEPDDFADASELVDMISRFAPEAAVWRYDSERIGGGGLAAWRETDHTPTLRLIHSDEPEEHEPTAVVSEGASLLESKLSHSPEPDKDTVELSEQELALLLSVPPPDDGGGGR
ncbi:MAG: hypothetical protein AAGB34_09045 [Planctomycetota bacterium]